MKKIYSKTIDTIDPEDGTKLIKIQVSDTPLMSDSEQVMEDILKDEKTERQIIDLFGRMEYDGHEPKETPSGTIKVNDDEYIFANIAKYKSEDDSGEEQNTYPQQKGNHILWSMMIEGLSKGLSGQLRYFFFFRDTMGNLHRLHSSDNKIDFEIPNAGPREYFHGFVIERADNKALDCGRYYFAFEIQDKDGKIIDNSIYHFINIVPNKAFKAGKVKSNLVGLEAVYRQMASLSKQKQFNESRAAMNLAPTPINLNAVVMGSKGSGKTSFADVLFDFYKDIQLLDNDAKLQKIDASRWCNMSESTEAMQEDYNNNEGNMLFVENASSMIAKDSRGNKNYAVEHLARMMHYNGKTCVVLSDTAERMTQLLATANLGDYFGQIYKLPNLTLEQMMEIADRECKERGFILTDGAKTSMTSYLSSLASVSTNDVKLLIDTMIMHMSERVVGVSQELFQDPKILSELQAEDVPQVKIGGFDRTMNKLNNLVGLKKLKYNIESHLNLVRFTQLRNRNGLKATMPPLHMIFTGNPGTGKTTVAGLLGEIYASIGILKTGNVVYMDRKKLVGQYIGDTEENTKNALKQAHGNILFIDEAYTLVGDPDDKKDYGPKVLECLLEELSKEQTDMIIILAGYPDEMEKMLDSNKGLKSRFPYTFHFEDYTEDELLEIAVRTAELNGYTFGDEALARVRTLIHREIEHAARDRKHFGNARMVTRLISTQIIPNMSRRVLSDTLSDLSKQRLSRIETEDIPARLETDYAPDEALINRTLKQLDEMVGLANIKRTLHDIVTIARSQHQKQEDIFEIIPLQWTFTGATGTGKSSVAKLLAQLMHAFHLISSDRMTQLRMQQSQAGMWTPYDVDKLLRDTMKQSGQGLLFIDLDDVANNHIDIRWLRCKLTSLTAEMPGSYAFVIAVDDRRISTQPINMPISTSILHFEDYTADELLAILKQRLTKHAYSMTPEAEEEVYRHIQDICAKRNTGLANARTIRHIYTAVTSAAEIRLANTPAPSVPVTITQEDISSFTWNKLPSNRIGFGG